MNLPLARRRSLRRNSTRTEAALWSQLRGRRFAAVKFRRQHPCGPFILDFFCAAKGLAIEIDGGRHFEPASQAYDEGRTAFLARNGIRVLRFTNDQVALEMEGVLMTIAAVLEIDDLSP